MRIAITDTALAELRQDTPLPADIWDAKVSGLVLRLRTSGGSWFVRARTRDGKRTALKLGEHPALRIADARRLARDQLAAIQQGGDPVAERRVARQERRETGLTVGAALADWQSARSTSSDKPWSPRYTRAVASAISVHIPATIRTKPLRDVGREPWTSLLTKVTARTPGAAAFLYTSISSFLAYAEALGWIEHHPLPRRARNLIAPHGAARTRVLEDQEWLAVWQAAEREPPKLRAFVRLLLLTATRVSETADIAVGEIIADGGLWRLPADRVKNNREHLIPLGELAQHELRLVWPPGEPSPNDCHRLLGRFTNRGFTGQGKLMTRIQKASGTANWTWHDLRRTARTGMSYLDVTEADAEAALNHVAQRSRLVAIYDHSGPLPSALTALRTWQGYVADVVAGRRPVGDAEAQYRSALPEELRYRTRPKFIPKLKAKPGRPARTKLTAG